MRGTSALGAANLLVWGACLGLALGARTDLRWGLEQLPRYVEGDIPAPRERGLYREAAARLEVEGASTEARRLLDASLAIDPYGEAGYWLGRWYERAGERDRALGLYEGYLGRDPDHVDSWVRAILLREAAGDRSGALALAQRGRRHFEARELAMRPRYDSSVARTANRKARELHARLRAAAQRMTRAERRLDGARSEAPAG